MHATLLNAMTVIWGLPFGQWHMANASKSVLKNSAAHCPFLNALKGYKDQKRTTPLLICDWKSQEASPQSRQ